MPTYDYRCPNGHDFEHFFRKISDAAAQLECPVCGAVAARRVSGGAGLVFKGSGFYLTDYGKNAHRKGGGAGGGGSDTSGSSTGGESSPSGGDAPKGDAGSATTPKSDSATAPKSEAAKTTESKPSGKTKGSDNE
jgi:putative FmdB family regulatory protein